MTQTEPTTPPAVDLRTPESVIIRPWPKVVFLYPTFLFATVFFLLRWLDWVSATTLGNLLVFSFDFSRIKSITIVIGIIATALLILWVDTKWDVTGFLGGALRGIDVQMNAQFYGFFSMGLGLIFLLIFINSRFHYYEVNAREILHHHGYLGDITRWSTEGLEMNKRIEDVVEYALLRSGRLIFMPASSKQAIVMDNVANVNWIEERVNDLLSVVAVRVNQRPGPG